MNAAKTECKNGHQLDGDNLYITSKGERKCRYCMKLNDRRRYTGDGVDTESWKLRKDTHDYFDDSLVHTFLRNHNTGVGNHGRRALGHILASYARPKVIDNACGTCVNWEVFKKMGVDCEYVGVDRTRKLLDHARSLYGDEIKLVEGYAQELDELGLDADVVIIRHLLEHLPQGAYEEVIEKALNVAKREVIVVFFLTPSDDAGDVVEKHGPDERDCYYYWNVYSWPKFKNFVTPLVSEIKVGQVLTPGAAHADTIVRLIK